MNQSTIHAADCSCSKCAAPYGTSLQRRRRFLIVMFLYIAVLIAAGTAIITATAVQ
ncbi:MAG: hypothetical protein KYX66_12395 [Blastomonas fulva]|uniref:hypothetical protein n=1 Tax=Blastomonas fulva TaxID=1550728 RepID=UPI0024E2432B|nr:hypothetical protein [Blastomonas fulva]MDK2757525.1 hypothetical protein [Blastomonas fulva]